MLKFFHDLSAHGHHFTYVSICHMITNAIVSHINVGEVTSMYVDGCMYNLFFVKEQKQN